MKITADTPHLWRYKATLDGEEVPPFCFEADEDAGYIKCVVGRTTASGSLVPDLDETGQHIVVTHHGVVVITPPVQP